MFNHSNYLGGFEPPFNVQFCNLFAIGITYSKWYNFFIYVALLTWL
jgi:hypothetical protein